MKKLIITKDSGIPLIGHIAFGIIDRGTNLLEVRPTTICPLNCPFCSTGSGPNSRIHKIDYEVELNYLIDWLKQILKIKGELIEINSPGEPASYPKLKELIESIKKIKNIKISMQTNGYLLNKNSIKQLEKAGLDQINFSINTLDKEKAKLLSGTKTYKIEKIKEIAKTISKSKIKLIIAPIWLPGINNKDIEEIIKYTKEIDAISGIQKYEIYKYGRKMKKAKHLNWWKFYNQLKKWEKQYNTKLILKKEDMDIKKAPRIPSPIKKGEKLYATIKAPGWIDNQMIAAARNRCISVNNCHNKINDKIRIKILEDKNNIFIGEKI